MAFALVSRSKRATLVSSTSARKKKFRLGHCELASRSGFDKSASRVDATALPTLPVIQTKLKIGEPNDKFEREADQIAQEVMRMPDSEVSGISKSSARLQTKCAACARGEGLCAKCAEEENLHAKKVIDRTPEVTPQLEAQLNDIKGDGRPLPRSVRAFFEPRFGYGFSSVRVHNGARAANLARAINARALTVGDNIVFGAGCYAPETLDGQRLLAHELTHVVQQKAASNRMLTQTNVPAPRQALTINPAGSKRLQRQSAQETCPKGFKRIDRATWFHCGEAGARNLACAVCTSAGRRDCNCGNIVKTLGHSNIIAPQRIGRCGDIFEITTPGRTDPPLEVTLAERPPTPRENMPKPTPLDIHRDVIPQLGLDIERGRYSVCLRQTERHDDRVVRCGPARCSPPAASPITSLLQRQSEGPEENNEKNNFKDCPKKTTGDIEKGRKEAKKLAERAQRVLIRHGTLPSFFLPPLVRHFGGVNMAQKGRIIDVYRHIQSSIDHKFYKCDPCKDKWESTGEFSPGVTHDCARSPCPGNEIFLCPPFARAGCPRDLTILHEAAHNAGACDDIDKGAGYPPAKSENNAYSYEHFADEIRQIKRKSKTP